MPTEQIHVGVATTLVNALAVGAGVNSNTFALPAQACMISWSISFGTNPASDTINLQVSNDASNWSTLDNASAIVATTRHTFTAAKFCRINMSAVVGGDNFTVIVNLNPVQARNLLTGTGFVVSQAAQVGNGAIAGETDLFALTIPARTLISTGKSIRIRWAGNTAANGNVKTGRVRFGGDTFVLFNSAINNVDFRGEYIVMRRSFGIQIRNGITNLNAIAPATVTLAIAVDETLPISLTITGQSGGSAANDILLQYVIVDTVPDIPGLP